MVKKILLGIAIVIGVLLIIIASRPDQFRVTRSTTINAAPPAVFEHVNNFHRWEAWSPWVKLDPKATVEYQGPEAGVGAVFKWAGNEQVGEGVETIVVSRPYELIEIKLEFIKPFKGVNTVEFTFKPAGDQTVVSWSMYGKNNFMSKAMGLFMNCDQYIGKQFEQGLAQLKAVVEKK